MKSKKRLVYIMLISLAFAGNNSQAQLKIYLNTDLEGISGVFNFKQTREKGSPENLKACEYFMDDLAAVIKGLREGGASEIVVLDGHGNQAVVPELMSPGATYITGRPRPGAGALTLLDSTFNAMVMIGFHAMNGISDGVLNHTQSSRSENKYWYNGIECGELFQNAVIAGYFNVPVIMVSGDEATCREAKQFFGDNCVTVASKKGIAREAAQLYPFKKTRADLYEGAKQALKVISKCKPYKMDFPVTAKKQYQVSEPGADKPKIIVTEKIIDHPLKILDI